MTPEEEAREEIDDLLRDAGWVIQDFSDLNLSASTGVAVREFPVETGDADYTLFIDEQAVGILEAKPVGTTLSGVETQSKKYLEGFPSEYDYAERPLPFAYESTGTQTYFRDTRDDDPQSRQVFAFHQPETLSEWLRKGSLHSRLNSMPALREEGLRDCQTEAIHGLENALQRGNQRALVQMATGSGKTYMAATEAYRLIKHADADRILFLVDRTSLGGQTDKEFQQFPVPGDGRKFTELYNVQKLTSNAIDPVSKVCISTIQRMYSILKDEELDEEVEEISDFEENFDDETPKTVSYNPDVPIESFDFIITDECHRSIYNLWRQVLEYFDARIIGLTATPSKETFGFFNQNLVTEYPHQRAVADGVNVGYDVFRIKTRISERGEEVESGHVVDERDKRTRDRQWKELDDDLVYSSTDLDRDIVAEDQIRTVLTSFRDNLDDIYPDREHVPKTLIFAKDDSHAEDITRITREVFDKGTEFCKKITYKTTGKSPEDLISEFRNSYNPRVAVSVDMVSTGVDIKPLECLIFMRDVNSRTYFEQMKGRGTRTISKDDIQSVTPDADEKDHFVIVDAVGVCESDKTDSHSMNRSRSTPFDTLLENVAGGDRDDDTLETLVSRLSRRQNRWTPGQIDEIEDAAGTEFHGIINDLLDAVDPDEQEARAKELFETEDPSEEQLEDARDELVQDACVIFEDGEFREMLLTVDEQQKQIIDTVSQDTVISAELDEQAKEQAELVVDTFEEFIEENKCEITALQMMYSQSYGEELSYEEIKELGDALKKPPYNLTPERVWDAYEQLDETAESTQRSEVVLADLIALIRYELEQVDRLEPFSEVVDERFEAWLDEQGRENFTEEQLEWLRMIKEHIKSSVEMETDDFEGPPFNQRGGLVHAHSLFGENLEVIVSELNEELTYG